MNADVRTEGFERLAHVILMIASVALVIVLVYAVYPVLSPFLIALAIVLLLYPEREHPLIRRIIWLALLLFVVWLFRSLIGVLAPFLIALFIAYLFNPLVTRLAARAVPRWVSSLTFLFVILGAIIAAFILLIPLIIEQFREIIASISNFVTTAVDALKEGRLMKTLADYGLPAAQIQEFLSRELPGRMEILLKSLLEGAFGFFTGITTILGQVVDLVIIPFVTFYVLKDYPMIMEAFADLLPEGRREPVTAYLGRVDDLLGRYLRGVLVVALVQGIAVTIGLLIIGVPSALVLGMMSGTLNLIPIVGFYFSLLVSLIVALLSGGPVLAKVISVIALYVGLNIFENSVLAPKIVGRSVGVHPALLILSLVVFGTLMGFVGLLVAVPLTAVILMSLREWRDRSSRVELAGGAQ